MADNRRSRLPIGEKILAEHNRLALKAFKYHPDGGFSYKTALTEEEAYKRGLTQAVLEIRNSHNKEVINMKLAFPSSPHRPPTHTLDFMRNGKNVACVGFAQAYAARVFFDAVARKDDYKWRDDQTVVFPDLDNLMIKSDTLEEIVEYKLTAKEKEWELPAPYDGQAEAIRSGQRVVIKPKPERKPDDKPKRERKSRASADGLTSLADICAELKIEPRDARAFLRKKIDKPDAGWAWPDKEVANIKKLLKEIKS